jgi:hypothetical protein
MGWFGWSDGEWIAVGATAGALVGLVTAVIAHLRPATTKEPVAVGASVTALATATAALGVAFGWWSTDPNIQGAVVGLVTALFGLLSAIFVRSSVTA